VPRFTYVGQEQFDSAWHLASWVPTDPLGPTVLMMTVLMNRDCPIMLEAIKYHQEQNPDVFADEVAEIARTTYGEVAVCKIAHSQKLTKYVNEQDLDERYAITFAAFLCTPTEEDGASVNWMETFEAPRRLATEAFPSSGKIYSSHRLAACARPPSRQPQSAPRQL
jgi:hypothetical protein